MVQSEQIICKVAFWYFRRMALMFLLLTGGGAWFYYDGLINWPNKNKIYLAKVAFEAGSEKRQWDDFTREIEKYDTVLSEEDLELIKNVFQDGKIPMQWAEYEISNEGKRGLANIELNKLKEAFLSGKRLDLSWEDFARNNEYPLTKDESLESQVGVEKFESLYNAFESSKDKRKWSLYGTLSGKKGWSDSEPKYHNSSEILAQIIIGSILLLSALYVLVLTLINRGRSIGSDEVSFTTEKGLVIDFKTINKIDTRKWNKKGLAYVFYVNEKGLPSKTVIDDLKYKGADEILERIKNEFTGELVENIPDVLTED